MGVRRRHATAVIRLTSALCLVVLGGWACRTTGSSPGPGGPGANPIEGPPVDPAGESYFDAVQCSLSGLICLPDRPRRNPFRWAFVDVQLAELGEPSLRAAGPAGEDVYRATIATSFHGTAIVRLDVSPEGGGTLTLWNPDGYCTNLAIRRTEPHITSLGQLQVDGLLAALEEAGFWAIGLRGTSSGLDGTDWYVEGARGGTHRLVHRSTPGEPLRTVAESFTAAAGCLHRPLE